jgi:hypothetical protein
MAGFTNNFSLAYFDFGDKLDQPLNIQHEIQRFVLIDKQMFGLYNIFGNGVIQGWNVTPGSGLSIRISAGIGIINNYAVETEFIQRIKEHCGLK